MSFPPLETATTMHLTPQQKASIAQGKKLIATLIPEKNINHYHQALLSLITGQKMIKIQLTPTNRNISAYQFYRLLAKMSRLGLQYPNHPKATLPQLKQLITPWVNDIQVSIPSSKG